MDGSDFSVGVEEEYQLVDPETGALRSRARQVLDSDWGDELYAELQETMLEIGTQVCASSADLEQELRRLRLHVGTVAASQELDFVAAGLHPFSRWEGQHASRGERYDRILKLYGRVLRTEHIFGMHVHVAVPEQVDRVRLLGELRGYLPLLLALSASSPFFEGEDTGYASYRTILGRRLPNSGIPPRFGSASEYQRYLTLLTGAGALEDGGSLYWSLRPHPRYPTLEFRTTDVCPRVEDAVAIAGLIRTLVFAAAEGRMQAGNAQISSSAEDALLATNEWQAARFGLEALLIAPEHPAGHERVRESILRHLEDLLPVAEYLGESESLRRVGKLLERGNAAERMRAVHALHPAEWPLLVRWLAAESQLGVGLDRRTAQRG